MSESSWRLSLLATLLALGLMIDETVSAVAIDCSDDPAEYIGDPRRNVPSDMWRDIRLLPIDGSLPEPLQG